MPSGAAGRLQNDRFVPLLPQFVGATEPGEPGAGDNHLFLRAHWLVRLDRRRRRQQSQSGSARHTFFGSPQSFCRHGPATSHCAVSNSPPAPVRNLLAAPKTA